MIRTGNAPSIIGDTVLKVMARILGRNRYEAPSDGSGNFAFMKRFGTHVGTQLQTMIGDTPVKNWQGGPADYPTRDSNKINIGGSGIDKRETRKYHCAQCALGCGGIVSLEGVEKAKGKFTHTHKPEYETIGALGPLLLNTNPDSILYLNELLNRAGMDTISAGGTVAFAIECYENGLLTKEQTGDLELTWGNHEAIVAIVEQMITRETWLGDVLANGAKKAAEIIGRGSEAYAVTAGGQEPGMHDPRFDVAWGVSYSANPTPGKHTNTAIDGGAGYVNSFLWERVSYAPVPQRELKDDLTKPNPEYAFGTVLATWYKMLIDGVGGCIFGGLGGVNSWDIFEMLELATGWGKTADDYMEIGNRINTVRQLFNIKHGINPKDFLMHKRIETPRQSGPNKGRGVQMEPIVSLHWEKHGWDPNTGHPTAETVKKLKIDQLFAKVVL
jgi:aldehyde:ferredoxin oxidoreductase